MTENGKHSAPRDEPWPWWGDVLFLIAILGGSGFLFSLALGVAGG